MPAEAGEVCRICEAAARLVGQKRGAFSGRDFSLWQCSACKFSFIGDPWTDFEAIYSRQYYEGKGADPLVDYVFEMENPERSIRQYEWGGLLRCVRELVHVTSKTRWLDYGAGNGGLVRYVRKHAQCEAYAFEEGWIANQSARFGVPLLTPGELELMSGTFDVVTAVEVVEHLIDPLSFLKTVRALLRPGGLLFLTTGNARPVRDKLLSWGYVVPEVHVSFFEPGTLAQALARCGLRPSFPGFLPGFDQIVRFKVLKNLRIRSPNPVEGALPWNIIARSLDWRLRLSAHPVGWAPAADKA